MYDRLDVTLTGDDFYGESFYNDLLDPVVDELDRLGLLRESDGAKCVFPPGFTGRDGEPLPIIVRKSDGGYGYGATDLAAIRHRTETLKATRLLYVVGSPQRAHLEMVYAAARSAGWLPSNVDAIHVGFGSVLGADGRMLKTRSGETVKLIDLLDEAVSRAAALVSGTDLDPDTQASVAQAVGIGAIKYADLSTDRVKDYVLDWDRMLSFTGDTAGYMQYAHARIRSIFRKAGVTVDSSAGPVLIAEPAEHGLELLAFPAVVEEAARTLQIHKLAGYLHGLAATYTSFHETCRVLDAEAEVRASRLVLCGLTARILAQGLDLLGIRAPTRM